MKYIIFYVMIFMLCSCDYYFINNHKDHVGYINTSGVFMKEDLELCFKEKIFPNTTYGSNAGFMHSRDSLENYFKQTYINYGNTGESGYITIRFIINCSGETGYYEIFQLGTDYKERKFNSRTIEQLVVALRQLKDWKPVSFFDDKYDSYYHVSFKITNGALREVLL